MLLTLLAIVAVAAGVAVRGGGGGGGGGDGEVRAFAVKLRVDRAARRCALLSSGWTQRHRYAETARDGIHVERVPQWRLEGGETSHDEVVTVFAAPRGDAQHAAWRAARQRVCARLANTTAVDMKSEALSDVAPTLGDMPAGSEVFKFVDAGPSANRIDTVFMGDGYTSAQRQNYIDDMERLIKDMFEDDTFRAYLPLFNIWGVYVPSAQSGIGTHGRPRDTAFRLYRQGTQLRGVFTGAPQAIRNACRLADGCDYPACIGNDAYYGGLGGEFVIGTQSPTSGTVVLRHEMGHNYAAVGEEYDDGQVYTGFNSDSRLPPSIKWSHWLTEPSRRTEQRVKQHLGAYPWHDLAAGPRTYTFRSDGSYHRWMLRFTASGVPERGSLVVKLDGVPFDVAGAEWGLDRSFFIYGDQMAGLPAGEHRLEFAAGFPPPDQAPIRQLCSLTLHEYGNEEEFHWEPEYVGAYPTFSVSGRKTYRPTNEACLMRNMTSTRFGPACQEGMWLRHLARMSLIDDVAVNGSGSAPRSVVAKVVPIGQLRDRPVPGVTEALSAKWERNGAEQNELADKFEWQRAASDATGSWRLTVTYKTSEVRVDPNNVLTSTKTFSIS